MENRKRIPIHAVLILTALILALGCIGAVFAEIIPPCEPGQQIGYPAVVLCEELTLRAQPSASSSVTTQMCE